MEIVCAAALGYAFKCSCEIHVEREPDDKVLGKLRSPRYRPPGSSAEEARLEDNWWTHLELGACVFATEMEISVEVH